MSNQHTGVELGCAAVLSPKITQDLADRGMSQIVLLRDAWPFLSGSIMHAFDLVEVHRMDQVPDRRITSELEWRDVIDNHLVELSQLDPSTEEVTTEFDFVGKESVFGKQGIMVVVRFDVTNGQMRAEASLDTELGTGRYPHLLTPSPKISGSIEMVLAWFAHASEVLRAKYGSAVSLED